MEDASRRACVRAHKYMKRSKLYAYFGVPVDTSVTPGYLDIVPRPIDLGTVWANLERGDYATHDEYAADVRLCFANAVAYCGNGRFEAIESAALKLRRYFEGEWRKCTASVAPAPVTLGNFKLTLGAQAGGGVAKAPKAKKGGGHHAQSAPHDTRLIAVVREQCVKAVRRLSSKGFNAWFNTPVDLQVMTGYDVRVPAPMDYGTLGELLGDEGQGVDTIGAFAARARSVHANALRYNVDLPTAKAARDAAVKGLGALEAELGNLALFPAPLADWQLAAVDAISDMLAEPTLGQWAGPLAHYVLYPVQAYFDGGVPPQDFYNLVGSPMDFGTILSKLLTGNGMDGSGYYTHAVQFQADARRVFDNCRNFWSRSQTAAADPELAQSVVQAAGLLQAAFHKSMQNAASRNIQPGPLLTAVLAAKRQRKAEGATKKIKSRPKLGVDDDGFKIDYSDDDDEEDVGSEDEHWEPGMDEAKAQVPRRKPSKAAAKRSRAAYSAAGAGAAAAARVTKKPKVEPGLPDLKSRLGRVLKAVRAHQNNDTGEKTSKPFYNVPKGDEYASAIAKPMCISAIEARLKRNGYGNVDEFAHELALVFSNALKWFAGPENKAVRQAAMMLENFSESEIDKAKDAIAADGGLNVVLGVNAPLGSRVQSMPNLAAANVAASMAPAGALNAVAAHAALGMDGAVGAAAAAAMDFGLDRAMSTEPYPGLSLSTSPPPDHPPLANSPPPRSMTAPPPTTAAPPAPPAPVTDEANAEFLSYLLGWPVRNNPAGAAGFLPDVVKAVLPGAAQNEEYGTRLPALDENGDPWWLANAKKCLNKLKAHEWVNRKNKKCKIDFMDSVKVQYPDDWNTYKSAIARPIELKSIESTLLGGNYNGSVHVFAADVALVFANCKQFNDGVDSKDATEASEVASHLGEYWEWLCFEYIVPAGNERDFDLKEDLNKYLTYRKVLRNNHDDDLIGSTIASAVREIAEGNVFAPDAACAAQAAHTANSNAVQRRAAMDKLQASMGNPVKHATTALELADQKAMDYDSGFLVKERWHPERLELSRARRAEARLVQRNLSVGAILEDDGKDVFQLTKRLRAGKYRDEMYYFLHHEDIESIPEYSNFVARPMSIQRLEEGLKKDPPAYGTYGEVIKDLELVFINAIVFNGPRKANDEASEFAYQCAQNMLAAVRGLLHMFRLVVAERVLKAGVYGKRGARLQVDFDIKVKADQAARRLLNNAPAEQERERRVNFEQQAAEDREEVVKLMSDLNDPRWLWHDAYREYRQALDMSAQSAEERSKEAREGKAGSGSAAERLGGSAMGTAAARSRAAQVGEQAAAAVAQAAAEARRRRWAQAAPAATAAGTYAGAGGGPAASALPEARAAVQVRLGGVGGAPRRRPLAARCAAFGGDGDDDVDMDARAATAVAVAPPPSVSVAGGFPADGGADRFSAAPSALAARLETDRSAEHAPWPARPVLEWPAAADARPDVWTVECGASSRTAAVFKHSWTVEGVPFPLVLATVVTSAGRGAEPERPGRRGASAAAGHAGRLLSAPHGVPVEAAGGEDWALPLARLQAEALYLRRQASASHRCLLAAEPRPAELLRRDAALRVLVDEPFDWCDRHGCYATPGVVLQDGVAVVKVLGAAGALRVAVCGREVPL